jgi:hypothetical protein
VGSAIEADQVGYFFFVGVFFSAFFPTFFFGDFFAGFPLALAPDFFLGGGFASWVRLSKRTR